MGLEEAPNVTTVRADFTRDFDPPRLERGALDGILLANALHFVRDAATVLRQLATWLRIGGCVVIVEYDRRGANRWVPYPIPTVELPALSRSAGLGSPTLNRRPSRFGGELYVATMERPAR